MWRNGGRWSWNCLLPRGAAHARLRMRCWESWPPGRTSSPSPFTSITGTASAGVTVSRFPMQGHASYVGSDRRRISEALAATSNGIPVTLQVARGELEVSIGEAIGPGGYDVNLAAYLPQASTVVGRGENSGRTLAEFNIVRQFRR